MKYVHVYVLMYDVKIMILARVEQVYMLRYSYTEMNGMLK